MIELSFSDSISECTPTLSTVLIYTIPVLGSTLLTYLIAHKAQLDQTAVLWVLLGLTRKVLDLSIETVLSAYYQGLSIDPTRSDLHLIRNSLTSRDIDQCSFHYLEAIKLSPFESIYWHNYYSYHHHSRYFEIYNPFVFIRLFLEPANPVIF